MREIPNHLLQGERQPDQNFTGKERLYRRYMPAFGQDIDVDVIELPDISVLREKYAHAEDVIWSADGRFDGWGVCAFRVEDIPAHFTHLGIFAYDFAPVHAPHRHMYPHSEVRAYENGVHLDKLTIQLMDRAAQLRFRERLLQKTTIVLPPGSFVWDR